MFKATPITLRPTYNPSHFSRDTPTYTRSQPHASRKLFGNGTIAMVERFDYMGHSRIRSRISTAGFQLGKVATLLVQALENYVRYT